MVQGTVSLSNIYLGNQEIKVVDQIQYLRSTISSNLSLEPEIHKRIAKAAAVMSKLHKRVWSNNNLTKSTKMKVYRACVLYSSEAWSTYAVKEKKLNSFHLWYLRCIFGNR